jgi:hypothetical protein
LRPAPSTATLARAYGAVKLACTRTNRKLGYLTSVGNAIEPACEALHTGQLADHIIVDALQGGAGTSTNMNVNEVLANRALQQLGRPPGDYATISPARPRQPAPVHQRHLSHRAQGRLPPRTATSSKPPSSTWWRPSRSRSAARPS